MTFSRKLVLFIGCLAIAWLIGALATRSGTTLTVMRWLGYFMAAGGLAMLVLPRGDLTFRAVAPIAAAMVLNGAAVSGLLPISTLVTNFMLLAGIGAFAFLSRPAGQAPGR